MDKRVVGFLAAVLFVLGGKNLLLAGENLVPNGGFESGRDSWQFWPRGANVTTVYGVDSTVAKEGTASMKITSKGESSEVYAWIPIKGKKNYKLTFWYKLKGIIPDSGLLRAYLNFQDEGNKSIGTKIIPFPAGQTDTDWKKFEGAFTTPAETVLLQLCLGGSRQFLGTIWFDEVEVYKEEQTDSKLIPKTSSAPIIGGNNVLLAGENLVPNGGFEW